MGAPDKDNLQNYVAYRSKPRLPPRNAHDFHADKKV